MALQGPKSASDSTPKRPPPIGHIHADGMVVVHLGPEKTKYHVHKALLVHHSEYFAKALTGPWVEADQRVVSLDEVGAHEFNLFLHWLYTQQLPKTRQTLKSVVTGDPTTSLHMNSALLLVQAYSLGERLLAPAFRRDINNLFVAMFTPCHPRDWQSAVSYAFANIPNDRVILQFLVNVFCRDWDPSEDREDDQLTLLIFPAEFTARVMMRYAYMPKDGPKECYIEHASEEEKKSCANVHMVFIDSRVGYGYFGEPIPKRAN